MTEPGVSQYNYIAQSCQQQADYCLYQSNAPFNHLILSNIAHTLSQSITTSLHDALYNIFQPYVHCTINELINQAVPLRFIAALHYIKLNRVEDKFISIFPDSSTAQAYSDAHKFHIISDIIIQYQQRIIEFMKHEPQTNEINRSTTLLIGMLYVMKLFNNTRLSCYEIGSSAGLNTLFHRYCHNIQTIDRHGGISAVKIGDINSSVQCTSDWITPLPTSLTSLNITSDHITVRGSDRSPVDLHDSDSVTRLQSYVWPDNIDRLYRLQSALELAQSMNVHIDQYDACEYVLSYVKLHSNAITILYHTIVWQYLTHEAKHRIEQHMIELGRQATYDSPLVWLCMESTDQVDMSYTVQCRIWPNASQHTHQLPDRIILAYCHAHGTWIDCAPIKNIVIPD